MNDILEVPGPCVECSADKICADFQGRALCNDCWHAARERTTPFVVRRVSLPTWTLDRTYLEAEAKDFAREMERRSGGRETWEHAPTTHWYGDRIAHPGYMTERRAAVLAAHPEYG